MWYVNLAIADLPRLNYLHLIEVSSPRTDQPNGKFNSTVLKASGEDLGGALGLSGSSWVCHSVN